YKKLFLKSLPVLRKNIVIKGNTAVIDASGPNLIGARFIAFYYNPKVEYGIRLIKPGDDFVLGVAENPWHRPGKKRQIGYFLLRNFGGGGHQYVAVARFKTKEEALKAIPKILKFLKN
ncbi:MAG: hypothetical protein HY456_02170, partial [Parcubacteria group bacterium]|nr:hypothetical protein [Parcubacteria group bacterium]